MALEGIGLRVRSLRPLSDVDTMMDAVRVAETAPGGRFAAGVRELAGARRARAGV
jgi:hypothetical protein